MQFKVPQNVRREDTIVANITIKQMIIIIAGGGLDYMIYIAMTKQGLSAVLWAPPVVVLGLLTAAIAFLKIKGIPFYKYVLLIIERMAIPRKRMWKKGEAEIYQGIFATKTALQKQKQKQKNSKESEERRETLSHINRLSQILDSQGKEEEIKHSEIDNAHEDELLHTAYRTGVNKEKIDKKKEDVKKINVRSKDEILKKPEPETTSETQPKPDVFEEKKEKEAGIVEILAENKEPKTPATPEAPEIPDAGEIDLSQKQGTISIK